MSDELRISEQASGPDSAVLTDQSCSRGLGVPGAACQRTRVTHTLQHFLHLREGGIFCRMLLTLVLLWLKIFKVHFYYKTLPLSAWSSELSADDWSKPLQGSPWLHNFTNWSPQILLTLVLACQSSQKCMCVWCVCVRAPKDLVYEYSFSVGDRLPRTLYQGRDFQYYFSLPSGDPRDDYKGKHTKTHCCLRSINRIIIFSNISLFFYCSYYCCRRSNYLHRNKKQHVWVSHQTLSCHSTSPTKLPQRHLVFLFPSWSWSWAVRTPMWSYYDDMICRCLVLST